jgi:pimeloyl-ACP methyl ester carboxylesterase
MPISKINGCEIYYEMSGSGPDVIFIHGEDHGILPEHYIKAAEFYTSMPNLVPRLKEIACPVLGICGEDDPCPDDPELLDGSKNFKQVWIPGARRFSMLESSSAFNTALTDFLRTLAWHQGD